jgi:putative tryptophan/tyrosine transport system substrate-binding protein
MERRRSRLSRRQFVAGAGAGGLGLVAGCGRLPLPGAPQVPAPVRRIGVLSVTAPSSFTLEGFGQGLRELGWVEGQNIAIDWRSTPDDHEALVVLAAELVQLDVNVLVVQGQGASEAARRATSTIPIVQMSGVDLVASGSAERLARPGANITGITNIPAELTGKRLELLQQTAPGMSRVVLLGPRPSPGFAAIAEAADRAAVLLGIELDSLPLDRPEDLDRALDYVRSHPVQGLAVGTNEVTLPQRGRIVLAASELRLPAIYSDRRFVEDGGLMAYSPDVSRTPKRAAAFVGKILRGTNPADIPIERPMTFDFVVNMKTAQALGITFPNEILLQVTEVIQ